MRWRILVTVLMLGAAAALGASLGLATPWTDTRALEGQVSVASPLPELLYICEPTGPDPEPCPGDDSGADEIIFEGLEDITPGRTVSYDIRLRNISDQSGSNVDWDISALSIDITEVVDPGDDCDAVPTIWLEVTSENDNHYTGDAPPIPGSPSFGPALCSGGFMGQYHSDCVVHVAPGEHEDMVAFAELPLDTPMACEGNVWDISIQPTVQVH